MNTSGEPRLVVVTGTSSGLGAAIAGTLIESGYRVVGISRRAHPAPPQTSYYHICADLSDIDAIPTLVRRICDDYGDPYGLVNNAALGIDGLLPLLPDASLAECLKVNLLAPMLLTKYACRPMISAGIGRIVNVSSITASSGSRGLSAYGAAKAGLEAFSRSLARELGPRRVTVNCVAPGFLETSMTDQMSDVDALRVRNRSALRRFAELSEVSSMIAYLLSDSAAAVTGATLPVDAGATA